jgi:membrane associated rhomboid family serine protease
MLPLRDNVPTRRFPVVTVALIAANVAVWVFYQLPDLDGSVRELAYQPCELANTCPQTGQDWWITWLTAMFMHAGWGHLLGNMLFLWIFGNNVEDALGRIRFLAFYLLGGIAATALQTFVTLQFGSPLEAAVPNLGASGAISAVLGAYLVLLPGARVLTLFGFFLVEVPAFYFLGFWFLFQLWLGNLSLMQPEAGGGVAFFAHIGGFVFGAVTVRAFMRRPPLPPARPVPVRRVV